MSYWIIDSHEDIAYNMLAFGRDYLHSAAETRTLEAGSPTPARNGDTLLGWSDYQRGRVGLVFATLFATPRRYAEPWDVQAYTTFAQGRQLFHNQLEAYHRLWGEHPEKFRPVLNRRQLSEVLQPWQQADDPASAHPVGMLVLMEGAEALESPEELVEFWEHGVRMVGPVWAGTRYCGGTKEYGSFSREGRRLLEMMAELGMILDLSHMTEESALQALDLYPGALAASHANARAILRDGGERQLTDRTLQRLCERGGVVGVVPLNQFLRPGILKSDPRRDTPLDWLAVHIDHICQVSGDARHVGIGTDFDGGFGVQHVPPEIDTIADMQKLTPLLEARGYTPEDIQAILGGNWQRHLETALPE